MKKHCISIKKTVLFFSLLISCSFAHAAWYWENPRTVSSSGSESVFPKSVYSSSSTEAAVFWEQVDSSTKNIYISGSLTEDGSSWSTSSRILGPFAYSGDVPDLYSATMAHDGTIVIAAVSIDGKISVYHSQKGSLAFEKVWEFSGENQLLAPRLYVSSGGSIFLFASLSKDENFSIVFSTSSDGSEWKELSSFEPSSGFSNAMVPYLAPVKGGDMVVYQAHHAVGNRNTFQLYASVTSNGGRTWSSPSLLTGENSMQKGDSTGFEGYNNQSPSLLTVDGHTYLAWERTRYGSTNSSVWIAELSSFGELSSSPEKISSTGNASRPFLFEYENTVGVLWFDTRSGVSQVYANQKTHVNWDTEDEVKLSVTGRASSFAVPVVSVKGRSLSFAWQEQVSSSSRIAVLVSDSSCPSPVLKPVNFVSGRTYASETARLSVTLSEDSSGLAGFSYVWSKDKNASLPLTVEHMPHEAGTAISVRADEEGEWFFKVRQCDNAGNWSEEVIATYRYDATPPLKPLVTPPELDSYGFVSSNAFTVNWKNDDSDTDIAGYTWSFTYIAPLPAELASNRHHKISLSDEEVSSALEFLLESHKVQIASAPVPNRSLGTATRASYSNRRNGLYVFAVASLDAVGHIGEVERIPLVINKYNPSTYISGVRSSQDDDGIIHMSISGSGFTYDGSVTEVYVDRDGEAPYDITLYARDGSFKVDSDSAISGIVLQELEAGDYFVGVRHPVRGVYFAAPSSSTMLSVSEAGTVKFNSEYEYVPTWESFRNYFKYHINITMVILLLLLLLALIGFAASLHGIAKTAKEAILIHAEVDAIIKGGFMPQKKKELKLKQKTTSLKYKLIGYSASLVITIVALITFPLALYMTNQQKQTLYEGLQSRVNVLLDALAVEAKTNLPPAPAEDRDKLDNLPDQMEALQSKTENAKSVNFVSTWREALMQKTGLYDASTIAGEAVYVTITGFDDELETVHFDYVWATNDVEINPPLENADAVSSFVPGTDRLFDFKSGQEKIYVEKILADCSRLNGNVAEEAAILESMYGASSDSPNTKRYRDEMDALLSSLSSESIGSYPSYDLQNMDESVDEYIFFEPVLDTPSSLEANADNYVRGIVLVKVNTESLKLSVKNSRIDILLITLAVILLAVLIGFLGSLLLAGIIIKPIKKLVSHVAMIRDTEDKEQLAGRDIAVTSRDEIGILGDTVNEMTRGLVQAAIASKNLVVGKEVQTRFLPLQTDSKGSQLTTGSLSVSGADFFSYYNGADELSGDYFDYRQIDKDRYAIIKCDVSGHGVPAALIMVEVATLFLNYFSKWNPKQNVQSALQTIVGRINDLLEQRGFKGRFAAFTLCVLNTASGEAFFCNAGDNLVQVYDGVEQKKKTVTLPETPAAGMFSTDLVEMKGGYPVSRYVLKKGDVLFLYTDGIEEAKRNFRDADGKIIPCAQQGLAVDEDHGNHKVGETSEEMTPERVTAIIESVFRREVYELSKWHNPNVEEQFTFDFTSCTGTAEEAIMALVSVEKVFRLYKDASTKPTDKIKVDRKIDEFLSAHFRQYSSYASEKADVEGDSQYVWWKGVCEDPQYDDLTLIAIKKN